MKRVGLVTYEKVPELTADDALLIEPLRELGVKAIPAIWDSPEVDWLGFDAVVVRSCWDYHHKPRTFEQWVDRLKKAGVPLWNPPSILGWNMRKSYLQDLEKKGASIPPTIWVDSGPSSDLESLLQESGFEKAVIKPVISATAWQTWCTTREEAGRRQADFDGIVAGSGAMIQQFIDGVTTFGEWSFIYLGGKFSHAVRKWPKQGDFRVQSDFGGSHSKEKPSRDLLQQTTRILELVDHPVLYARIDGIETNGRLTLIELELIEPQLFLGLEAKAPRRFAEAIVAIL